MASFRPSGENRGFNQSELVARRADVFPSGVIQSMAPPITLVTTPGTYASVPSKDTSTCAPPDAAEDESLRSPTQPGPPSRDGPDRRARRRACPAGCRGGARLRARRASASQARSAHSGRSTPPGTTTLAGPACADPSAARDATTTLAASKPVKAECSVKRTALPPGSICGHRCVVAPGLSVPNSVGFPPPAGTRMKPDVTATGRAEDDRVVVGPRAAATRLGVAQVDRHTAGDRDLLQLVPEKNATHWPSGEKNG